MLSIAEWKELAFASGCIFYMLVGVWWIADTIIQNKKRQAQLKRELRKLKWREARYKCGY